MKLINQSWQWTQKPENALEIIESAGRTCYKSEDKITPGSAANFVAMILRSGHESVLEHVIAGVRFVTNRGVTHELVRHRLAAYSQESTRYVNYGNDDIGFIIPVWLHGKLRFSYDIPAKTRFIKACEDAEDNYKFLIDEGWSREQSREVLPNALKTEIVVTANLREWRHIFKLRTSTAAHPQMRALMIDCLGGFKAAVPVVFDDI